MRAEVDLELDIQIQFCYDLSQFLLRGGVNAVFRNCLQKHGQQGFASTHDIDAFGGIYCVIKSVAYTCSFLPCFGFAPALLRERVSIMSLKKRNSIYHLRVCVPIDLQPTLLKKELHFSLKTGNKRLAKQKARMLAPCLHIAFLKVREADNMTMNKDQINQIIRDYVTGKLLEFDLEMATANPGQLYEGYDAAIMHLDQAYMNGQHTATKSSQVDDILQGLGILLDKESASYQLLCREVLKAEIRTLEAAKGKLDWELKGNDLESILKDLDVGEVAYTHDNPKSVPVLADAGPMLADLMIQFKDMKILSKKWSPTTIRNHQAKIDVLVAILGADKPINRITVADMREVAGQIAKGRDVSTQRDYMNFIRSIFGYALDNEFIEKNPVIKGLIPDRKTAGTREQRLAFDDPEDLQQIFGNGYHEWSKYQPSRYWLPLLALYTGCRLEELASLYTEHVHKVKGIWCIEINKDYDRLVKNENSIRTVPLHPMVAEGFAEYACSQPVGGRVFPELKKVNHKYGHYFSKRFGRYLRKKVGITDPKKVFHSFRHNVSDHLYKALVQESLIEELTGRAGKTETSRRYAKGYRVPTLYEECVLKLDYKFKMKDKPLKFIQTGSAAAG
jgi:integrase